jgi:hypothetical protein
MRLTLATSALLALPTSAAASHDEFLLAQQPNHQGITKRANPSAGQSRVLKNMLHGAQQRGNVRRLGKADLFENARVLKNKNKNRRTLQEGAECDPTGDAIDLDTGVLRCGTVDLICIPSDATIPTAGVCTSFGGGLEGDECDPTADAIDMDTGVFQCGFGLSCTPNDTSTMGGTCDGLGNGIGDGLDGFDGLGDALNGFIFAALCNGNYDSCDCSEFDLTFGTGAINCEFCISTDDLSATNVQTINVEENAILSSFSCGTVTKPYEQSYCYNVVYDQEDASASTCEVTVGDDTCTSCVYDLECTTFDCTNTVGNAIAGDFCDDYPLPIINEIDGIVDDPNFNPDDAKCDGAAGLIGKYLAASTFATMVVIGYFIV